MLSLHTNNASLSAQNSIAKTQSQLSTSMTRLSTGYRINSAMDDAAGLQIATRLKAQTSGMTVAMSNTQNSTSMLQTAEGAFGEVTNMLVRMKDLATQAADASSNGADKTAMQAEYNALGAELYNVMTNTTFGGSNLLGSGVSTSGTLSASMTFQIGASSSEKMSIDVSTDMSTLNTALKAVSSSFTSATTLGGELTATASTTAGANYTIGLLATAIDNVGTVRSALGAAANRLDHINSNVRISRLMREQAMVTQYQDNIATVKVRLLKNENYLSSMVTDMGQARDLLVWAADGSNAPDDLNAMTQSLTAMRDSVLYTANLKDQEGRYMFSGTDTDKPAIAFDPAADPGLRYSYNGNNATQTVVVGNGVTQAANVDVDKLEVWLNKIDQAIATLSKPGVGPNDPAVRSVVGAALDGTDDGMDLLSGKIAIFGGAQNILTTLSGNLANVSLSNDMALSDLKKTDMGAAAIDLNGYQTALQATYKAYAKVGTISLFDLL